MSLVTDRLQDPWKTWLRAVPWRTASAVQHTRWLGLCSCRANHSCCIQPASSSFNV